MSANLPYDENPGQTHYEGCWRTRHHHNCAVRRAEQLYAAMMDERVDHLAALDNLLQHKARLAELEGLLERMPPAARQSWHSGTHGAGIPFVDTTDTDIDLATYADVAQWLGDVAAALEAKS